MRVLFAAVPGHGLFLSTVPLAWALRAAGHEVLMANTGPAVAAAAEAGLPVVDVCPGQDVWGEFMAAVGGVAAGRPGELARAKGAFSLFGRRMLPGLIELGAAFRPDLVVGTIEQSAAPVLAGQRGVPLVEHGIRLARGGLEDWVVRMREHSRADLAEAVAALGTESAQPAAIVDIRPPSVGGVATGRQWLMRFVPYNGSRPVPQWALRPAERPRVGMTLGSVIPAVGGAGAARAMIDGLATVDAEVVLALGDVDRRELGALPDNVVPVGWLPLSALLPNCAALVHHGGAGTALTALAYGVPQLVVPHGADQPANAAVVAERGVGLNRPHPVDPAELAGALRQVLTEPRFGTAATEVAAEIAAQPSPAEIAQRVAELTG